MNNKTIIKHSIDLDNMKCIESFTKEDVILTIDGTTKQVTKFEYDPKYDGYTIEHEE